MASLPTQSRLLQLPQELRDIILELALTEPGGLVADAASFMTPWTRFRAAGAKDKYRESNQVRYVCRQLYIETSALSLRYNDLEFHLPKDEAFVTVYDLFDRFYQNCSSRYLSDIRRIVILDSETEVPEEQVQLPQLLSPSLVRFCQQHSRATVIVRFAWGGGPCDENCEVIDCMIYLSSALGRPNPFPLAGGYIVGGIAEKLSTHFANVRCPDNLRFSCSHVLDEFAASINADGIFTQMWDDDVEIDFENGHEKWVAIAREVHERGI